jgi:Holliday junction resolvasome RuvABC DNA-binding subunit
MPVVQIPGVGDVTFPDNMSDSDISAVIRSQILPTIKPVQAKPEPGITSEIGSILKSGAGQGIAGLGKLGQYAGIGGKDLEEYGAGMTKRATEALSPGTQAALQRQFLQAAPEGQGFLGYQLGDAKLTDIPAQFLQSVPVMAGTMAAAAGATALAPASAVAGVGTGVLGFLGRVGLGKVAGRITTAAGAKAGAAEALAGKLAINTLAGNVAEGLAAAGSSGIETEKAISDFAKLNPDGFFRSPIGQQALQDADGDKNKAIELGAFRAGRSAAALTGVSTAILATPGSAFESLAVFGKGAKSGRLHSAIMGGITEGPLQELPQGSAEQYIQNLQRIQAGEQISPGKGVLEAGVQGAIIGTPMGGALGAITGSGKAQELPPLDTQFQVLASKYQENGLNATNAYHTAAKDIEKYAQPGETLTVYDSLGRDIEATIVGKNETGKTIANVAGGEFVLGNEFTVSDPKDGRYGFKKGDEFVASSELNKDEVTAASDNIRTVINQFNTEFEQTKVKTPEHYSAERQGTSLDAADAILEAKEKKAQEEAVKPKTAKKPVVQAAPADAQTAASATPAEQATAQTVSVEQQAAIDLIDAVDKGGIPLNPAKVNAIAGGLGLEVTKKSKPEETIQRIRDAVGRITPTEQAVDIQASIDAATAAGQKATTEQAEEEQTVDEQDAKATAAEQKATTEQADSVVTAAQIKQWNGYQQTDEGFNFGDQHIGLYNQNISLASGTKEHPDGISIVFQGTFIGRRNERRPEFIDELKIPVSFKDVLRLYANQKINKNQAKQMIDEAMTKLAIIAADIKNKKAKQSRAPKKKSTPAAQNTLRQLLTEMREARNKEYYTKALPRVTALIYKRMNQIGLGKYVSNEFLASIKAGKNLEVNGEYVDKIIKLAIAGKSDKQIMSTLDHEAIHAMRKIGMITENEWKNLTNLAEKRGWINTFLINDRYKGKLNPTPDVLKVSGLTSEEWIKDAKYEEAIADAFSTYANGRSPVLEYDENNQPVYVYKKDLNLAGQPVGIINRILKILGIVKDVVSEDATFKRFVEAPIEADAAKLKAETASPKLSVAKADLGREKTGQLYEVYNRKTGKVVGGPYQTRSTARSGADRNDNKYGGYAHDVREVQEFGSDEGPEPTKQDLKKAQEEEKLEALDEAGVSQKFSVAPRLTTKETTKPIWYSELSRQIDKLPQKEMTAAQWKALLINPEETKSRGVRGPDNKVIPGEFITSKIPATSKLPGVKMKEIEDTEILEWLDVAGESFEVDDYIDVLNKKYGVRKEGRITYPGWEDSDLTADELRTLKNEQSGGRKNTKISKDEVQKFLADGGAKIEFQDRVLGEPVDKKELFDAEVEKRFKEEVEERANDRHSDYWQETIQKQATEEGKTFEDYFDLSKKEQFALFDRAMSEKNRKVEIEQDIGRDLRSSIYENMRYSNWEPETLVDEYTEFSGYQLPGGENYREAFVTVPNSPVKIITQVRRLTPEEIARNSSLKGKENKSWWGVVGDDGKLVNAALDTQDKATELLRELKSTDGEERFSGKIGGKSDWKDGHPSYSGIDNPVVRIRFNDRTDVDGNKVLFLEELQPPNNPEFGKMPKTLQGRWLAIGLKRMIRYAADNGYDKVAWTTGEQQVQRYESALRKQVDSIEWEKTPEGVHIKGYKGKRKDAATVESERVNAASKREAAAVLGRNDRLGFDTVGEALEAIWDARYDWRERWELNAEDSNVINTYLFNRTNAPPETFRYGIGEGKVADTRVAENDLTEVLGKVMADRIRKDPAQTGVIEGDNLTIDSPGVKKLYDVGVPAQANKILKEMGGGKVGETTLKDFEHITGMMREAAEAQFKEGIGGLKQPSFDITPALRERAMQGMSRFSVAPRINTDAFKRWFGDSKVVDEDGKPLRLYRGLADDYGPVMRIARDGALGSGIYMTPDANFAGEYTGESGGNIVPLYANLQNPLVIRTEQNKDPMTQALTMLGMTQAKAERLVEKAYEEKGYISTQVKTRAVAQGYDGIMQYRNGKLVEVVAFNNNQVKSIFNDSPTYNPDIRFSVAPRITKNIVQNDDGQFVYTGQIPSTLRSYLENSVFKDKDGNPILMFHGTAQDISEFRAKQAGAIFIAPNPDIAVNYSQESAQWMADHADEIVSPKQIAEALKKAKTLLRENGYNTSQIAKLSQNGILKTDEFREAISVYMPSGPNVMPMFVRAEKPFDYENADQVNEVIKQAKEFGGDFTKDQFSRTNNWTTIEEPTIQRAIKALGYDSFYVAENNSKNLAVYDSSQVKSVTGNTGEFNPESKDIRRSVAPKFAVKIAKGDNLNISKKVDEVGAYLDSITGEKLDWNDPKNLKQAVEKGVVEIKYMLSTQNNGLDWYEEDVAKAFEETAKKIPELKSETARRLFSIMSGIMSPQTNARDNWFIASKAFAHYVDTGVIPGNNPETGGLWQGGTTSLNKKKQLDMLDAMVRDMTEEGAVNWLFSTHTTRELNEFRKKYGNMGGTGEALSLESLGLRAFGPKVGPFVMNLNGIYEITVDMWMTRTANRWFGQVVDGNKKIVDAPTEPFRRVVKELVKDIASSTGIKPYQVQSVLWFFEQSLYRKLGTYAESYGFSDGAKRYSDEGAPRGGQMVRRGNENADGGNKRKESGEKLSVAPRLGDRGEGREKGGRFAPLKMAPSVKSVHGPDRRIVEVAERYAEENGFSLKRQAEYVEVDLRLRLPNPVRGERLANAYVAMLHAPQDPVVKEAYSNLIKQTTAQYRALEAAGYRFWFIDPNIEENLNYLSSPWNAIRDLRANQEMGVFPTTSGYGTNEFDVSNNPMLAQTGIEWPNGGIDGPLKTVLANDLFRAVHDAFGHGLEGAGFRADGEENAFQAHIRMYTGSAKGAITSETRGQNSEVNFGPNAEFNRTASGADTIYADQKTGLMPKWTWTEGIAKDEPEFRELDAEQDAEMFRKAVDRVKRGRKMAFPLHVHDVETYRNARLFLSEDKESGFALMGDEIGSFFSGGGGQAYPTLRLAVEEGGRRIDAYRSIMPRVLGKAGFRPVARVAFDPSQATEIWDYKKFERFQGGTPDLVFFAYDSVSKGSEQVEELVKKAPLVQYDEALALQAEAAGAENASGKYSHAMRYPDMLKANWPLVPETNFYRENPDRDDIAIYKGKFIQLPWGDDKKSFGMDHILHNAIRQSNRRWEQVTDKDDENAILGIIDILNAKDLKVFKESPLDNKIIIRSGKFKRAIILGENKDDLRIISVVPSEIPKFGKIIDQTPDVKMSDKVLYQYKNNFTGIKVNFRFETPPATVTVKKTRSYELPKQSIAPKFSTARTVGATKRPYTPEQLKYFSETGRTIEIPTLRERIQALFKNFSSNLAQGIADQFDPLKKLDPMAYLLARMSKGSSGALESLLKYGKLKIRGGLLYDADRSGGFLENVVMPMKGEFEDFLWWVAANRAGTLFGVGKENLFSPDNIIAGKALQDGTLTFSYKLSNGTTTTSRADMFKDSLAKYDSFNRNVLDMAEQSGLIDGSTRSVWEKTMYVPFFRVSEDQKGFIGQGIKKGLVRQAAFKTLKGGTNKLNSDLMSNVLQNWYHLIDASAKNRASNRALDVAVATGAAQAASESTIRSMGKSLDMRSGVVWDMRNGHKQYYLVEDQAVIEALTALEPANIPGPMMKGLHAFKYYLTLGVTISPYYKVRNLIRDSVQAVAVSDLSYNVLTNLEEGYAASDRKSQDYVTMLASGAVIRFGTSMEGNESGRVRALVNSGVKDSTILDSPGKIKSFFDKLRPLTEMYSDIGSRGEEINRAALYKRVLKKLTSQGMPSDEAHAQAAFLARDLMDFSMQGSWGTIRFLTQVVPFMNSRIQGLYKLGRAWKQDKARMAIVIGAASVLGLTLMAIFKDDDDWKKRTDADRNNYWWFKFGGIAYRIPKPFEVGAISTVAERGWELFFDNEMTGKRFSKNIESLLLDNLAMNPVPQVFKPLWDVYSNKDGHSGIPIETMGMERLLPEFRFTSETTAPAKALSTIAMGTLSPVQIDHMIKGYFAWLGTFVVGGADMGVNLVTSGQAKGPAKPSIDIISKISNGMVRTLPEKQSRYVNQIYEQAKELEQVYGTQQYLLHKRKIEEYREFTEEHKDELRKYRLIEPIKKLESALNKRIRQVEDNTTKDSDTKRVEINALNQRRDQLARRLSARFQ